MKPVDAGLRCRHCLDLTPFVEVDGELLCPVCDIPDQDDPWNWSADRLREENARDFEDFQASNR